MAEEQLARIEEQVLSRPWFYEFTLPSGNCTRSYLPEDILPIHATREQMLTAYLEAAIGTDWTSIRCLDLACHEGFFALKLALRGCREVIGIDARPEHIENAQLISQLYDIGNLTFRHADIQHITASTFEPFDITLLFGILYHIRDIVSTIELASALTRRICLIETQIAPSLTGTLEWGTRRAEKDIKGCFALVDEAPEVTSDNKEASLSRVSLVPSLEALLWLLHTAGFTNAQVLTPPPGAYEQLARGKRVMIAATKF